jgi:predicted unusual protein kinase regulating ubiquinone biosynthesis (AarF/ABC1/UbiB family)
MSEYKQSNNGSDSLSAMRYGGANIWSGGRQVREVESKRARRTRRAVRKSIRRWASMQDESLPSSLPLIDLQTQDVAHNDENPGECFAALPRRSSLIEMNAEVGPPMMRKIVFKASFLKVIKRLHAVLVTVIRWYAAKYWDQLRDRDSDERRALRLRLLIERMGGTAVKLGQQMSMRIDVMPYVYGVELSKMLDKMDAFPTEQAIEIIERQLKKPICEVFSKFDPVSIGNASVACVYQAILKSGEKVAVKVRRPGIGELFMADCKALALVFRLLEAATLIHPGLSHNFLFEFRSMLIEELDFVKEARHTELFRRRVRKDLNHVTAPRVYFEFSGSEVLVTEFVNGVWLKELIAAVESEDQEVLAFLRLRGIEPEIVAKRLVRANQYGIFENLLFHADPHPSNVLVQPDNELVFIDFGSCGAYTERERHNWRQLAYYQSREDVGRMVQSALAIIEPLPPIDIDEFSKRLEAVFWEDLYAFKSKHYQWYERTSARIWISFLNLAREYNISMNLNTLRMIRSTLLYETVAARIHPKIDAWREHRKYNKTAGKRSRKRVRRAVHKRLFEGLTKTDYLRVEQLFEMGNRIMYLIQRHLDSPPYRFSLLIGKAVYAVSLTFNLLRVAFFLTLTAAFVFMGLRYFKGTLGQASIWAIFTEIFWSRLYQFIFLGAAWLYMRRILFRMWDKEIRRDNSSGLS